MLAWLVPAAPPVIPPVTAGANHVYVVLAGTTPLVPLTGVTENAAALQVAAVIAVTAGLGFTVTVTVKVEPVQVPDVGVTVYVAVCAVFVGLVSVPDTASADLLRHLSYLRLLPVLSRSMLFLQAQLRWCC